MDSEHEAGQPPGQDSRAVRTGNLSHLGLDFNQTEEPKETIKELKDRVDLVAVVARYADLKQKHQGGCWWAKCPLHKEDTPSFRVDPEWQNYYCFGCGAHGDVIDFLKKVEGLAIGDAIRKVRELADGGGGAPVVDSVFQQARREAAKKKETLEERLNQDQALAIWRTAVPIRGTAVAEAVRYLRERRGLSSWDAQRLRWHPFCPFGTTNTGCIVAGVHNLDGDVTAIWRIKPSMEGKIERRGLGPVKGCAARLFESEVHLPLVVTEGVENALAARELTMYPAWSSLSASNMVALQLPPPGTICTEVWVLADGDERGTEAARALVKRLRAEGHQAHWAAPTSQGVKDPNDALQAR